jgi:hypothetical protein
MGGLELWEQGTETIGSTTITHDSSFHDHDYRQGNVITMTVSWTVDEGAASLNDFVLKRFSPISKKDPVIGELLEVTLLKDSYNGDGEGEVEVKLNFLEIHYDMERDIQIGNGLFQLMLNVDKNGDGAPETVAGFGVNVHVEGELDEVPPSISITNPVDSAVISYAKPYVTIEFSDDYTGINLSTFSVQINGKDSTSAFNVSDTRATCQTV